MRLSRTSQHAEEGYDPQRPPADQRVDSSGPASQNDTEISSELVILELYVSPASPSKASYTHSHAGHETRDGEVSWAHARRVSTCITSTTVDIRSYNL
eukprot:51549-Eustigmatos_ZCMA.PRE.2